MALGRPNPERPSAGRAGAFAAIPRDDGAAWVNERPNPRQKTSPCIPDYASCQQSSMTHRLAQSGHFLVGYACPHVVDVRHRGHVGSSPRAAKHEPRRRQTARAYRFDANLQICLPSRLPSCRSGTVSASQRSVQQRPWVTPHIFPMRAEQEVLSRGCLLKTANVRSVAARVPENVIRRHRRGIRGPDNWTSLVWHRATADQSLELASDRLLARTEPPFGAVPMRRRQLSARMAKSRINNVLP